MSERERFRVLLENAIEKQYMCGGPRVVLCLTPEEADEILALLSERQKPEPSVERDHRAMEALRKHGGALASYTTGEGRMWTKGSSKGWTDPADAILAAQEVDDATD